MGWSLALNLSVVSRGGAVLALVNKSEHVRKVPQGIEGIRLGLGTPL